MNLDIRNKYIYDDFLQIYFFFVVAALVVVVILLQISQSGIHKGCNCVKMQDKAQDNVSKRAAVEKNPSTLEKDQDLTRLLLDMKWKNRDINIVEQENIPQFSKLDDIGTPLRFFE